MRTTSTAGLLADFYEPDAAVAAAAKVRAAGWTHFDFLTPFPIHGMEEAMGHQRHGTSMLSATSLAPRKAARPQAAQRQPVNLSDALRSPADGREANVWRQARQMRDEWRKQRYARLRD